MSERLFASTAASASAKPISWLEGTASGTQYGRVDLIVPDNSSQERMAFRRYFPSNGASIGKATLLEILGDQIISEGRSVIDQSRGLNPPIFLHIPVNQKADMTYVSSAGTEYVIEAKRSFDYTKRWHEELSKRKEFHYNLIESLESEPIEDGYPHSAERIIKDVLMRYKTTAADWIQSTYLKNIKRPTISAGMLRCIGRLNHEMTTPWGLAMAISGLAHPEVEVREAAVRSLEMWGSEDSLEALKIFKDVEKVSWLRKYIEHVIVDLSE